MSILDLIYPHSCLGCGSGNKYVCDKCLSGVGHPIPVCPGCGKPSADGFCHSSCRTPLGLDGSISLFEHRGVIRKAIIAIKYKFATDCKKDILSHLFRYLKKREIVFPAFDYLVSVPLHWHRENHRGFNQSELLGREFADFLKTTYLPRVLIKSKKTFSQVELAGTDRKKNVFGSFSVNKNQVLKTGRYVIFDDVYTTGSTIRECCKVLKRKGVAEVWGLTISG